MNKKKVMILISCVIMLIVLVLFIILRNEDNIESLSNETKFESPSSDWFLEFNSIEEISTVRELLESGVEDDLIEFVMEAGNGHNVIESKKDVEYFLETIDSKTLPTDTNWLSFAYEHNLGMFFLTYNVNGADELSFIIYLEETFNQTIEENASDYTFTYITDEIAAFANHENFSDRSLRIGSGIQAVSFYRHATEMNSIRETEEGLTVSVSLNVEGNIVSATVCNASSLEAAFEILANIEFSKY